MLVLPEAGPNGADHLTEHLSGVLKKLRSDLAYVQMTHEGTQYEITDVEIKPTQSDFQVLVRYRELNTFNDNMLIPVPNNLETDKEVKAYLMGKGYSFN